VQNKEPAIVEIDPMGQSVHAVDSCSLANLPASQLTHAFLPASDILPAAQELHVAVPSLGANLPASQSVHVELFSKENLPVAQFTQVSLAAAEY
jgi:hypothetical protein